MKDFHDLIDLHVHSNYSDGALSPTELVHRAASLGLKVLALADHDSVAGIAEAIAASAGLKIDVIPAVELSVRYNTWQDVHLLGYGIDYTEKAFLNKLNDFRNRREHRNIEIVQRINDLLAEQGKEPIAIQEVAAFARDAIGRPHIARALMDRRYVSGVEDAFRRYLIPCNVPKLYWDIDNAISEIKRIGGIAILAHPTSITADREELRRLILDLRELGLDGLEVYNNQAHLDEMDFLRRLAEESGLVISGGSDFHGIEEGLEMGRGRGGVEFRHSLFAPLWDRLSG